MSVFPPPKFYATKKLSKKNKEKENTRAMYFFECINVVCDCLDLEEDSFITLLIYNKRPFGFASRSVVVSKGGFGFLSSPSGLKDDEYSRTQNENEKGCQIPTTKKKKKKTERTPRAKRIVFTVLVFSCFLLLDR